MRQAYLWLQACNPFIYRPRGMLRMWRALRTTPAERMQAVDLWLEFGGEEASRLLGMDPIDVTYRIVLASELKQQQATIDCDTYWGSHGCGLTADHDGPHWCCCECVNHPDPGSGCVGTAPYYGPETRFGHLNEPDEMNL